MMRAVIGVLALAIASPAFAGATTDATIQPARERGVADTRKPAPAPDAAGLAAARRVIALVMPPAEMDRMVESMIEPMFANIQRSMTDSPEMKALFSDDSKMQELFAREMQQQAARSAALLREGMPSMLEAMSRAYARRLTVAQLNDTAAFLATPSGQAYAKASPAIMNDPDVAAWMRDHMQQAMADMPARIEAMMKELDAPTKDK